MIFAKHSNITLIKIYKDLSSKKNPNKHVIKFLIKLEHELDRRGITTIR